MNVAAAIRALGWSCAGLMLGAGAAVGAEPTAGRASDMQRFADIDGSNRTRQRLDMALLSPGRVSFGVTMGLRGPVAAARAGLTPGAGEGVKSVNVGLQWRYVFDTNRSIDITAWRDLGRPDDALALIQSRDAGYGARVELQLAASRSPLVAERGFVGVQLDGGARITLRRSGGRPMVYYRNRF